MTRRLTIMAVGPQVLVQDLGRPGHRAVGVSPSGAADLGAHRLANRLVGNPESLAGLEVLAGGLTVRLDDGGVIAVAGADVPVEVDGRSVGRHRATHVRVGGVVTIGRPRSGLRSTLAVAGGIDVAPVLGSRSTDVLSGLGPDALAAGDVLPLGDPPAGVPDVDVVVRPLPGGAVLIGHGPRGDWITSDAQQELLRSAWTVTSTSNRVGVRLQGPVLARARTDELPSEGIVRGAIQVPPDGQPVVFLADHPVTGGYPIVGVVVDQHLDRLGQLGPGDRLRFRRATQR